MENKKMLFGRSLSVEAWSQLDFACDGSARVKLTLAPLGRPQDMPYIRVSRDCFCLHDCRRLPKQVQ